MSSNLPRFISEKEIAERKLRNEAEGKKEEPYDPRPLYDRLQAERARKQEEYEASTAFKNQIHRLDEDEVAFLTSVDRERNIIQESVDQEAELLIKEAKVVNRSALLKNSIPLCTSNEVSLRRPPIPAPSSSLNQKALLAGIKRKSSDPPKGIAKKVHIISENDNSESPSSVTVDDSEKNQGHLNSQSANLHDGFSNNQVISPSEVSKHGGVVHPSACVLAGYLPGLEAYSDSDATSDGAISSTSTDIEDAAVILSPITRNRGNKRYNDE